ncbi:HAD hydrolase-like protein [Streptomyces gobiensis]|uniref:HAD hydrolase-like protein n=1 Tax=Streptomyces gobiensis TaxID=2875706 RepID=UPI001E334896|nr:HAD hydrolase-like protein [Streptomyces gobiensis]UGY94281.1 HAD hydrolase-like protein [Streptomyces gobiensis]
MTVTAETLRLHGINPEPEIISRFTQAVAEELRARCSLLAEAGRVLPGAAEALLALSGLPGVHQSALTGNMRTLAELKLTVFGLAEHIDFAAGAYGDDATERTELLPHAWCRAKEYLKYSYNGSNTVIIGDTVLDIATAQAGGARVVAVATGSTSAEKLTAAGADVVLTDLSDTPAVLRAVRGREPVDL